MTDTGHSGRMACPKGGSRLILLADDSAVIRASMSGLIRSMGHRVDVVSDGTGALAALAKTGADYDLVLLDIQMPGMGGVETAAQITRGLDHRPRVVGVSAETEGVVVSESSGFDAVLSKPLRAAEVARLIESTGVRDRT